jgi:cytoskeletal protein RodZ
MSDDLFNDTFGGDNLFEDEEEQQEQAAGEGQNRTFLIAVAVLGGLLACALISFGVWALVINPNMQRAAEQAGDVVGMVTETPAADVVVEATATLEPTATPKPTATPTATPVIGPTATPKDDAGDGDAPTPTPVRERRTETPTPEGSPEVTPTKSTTASSGSTSDSLPDSGLGEISLVAGALLMVVAFLAARKLRSA